MNKRWLALFFGQVQMTVTGERAEAFINRCLENEVAISNIRRIKQNQISCTVAAYDVRRLRPLLRQSYCRLHIVKRSGLPFFLTRLSFHKGFVAGLFIFVSVLFLLSNIVWRVQITGADPKTTHEIREQLEKMGVTPGKFQFLLPAKEDLQYAITDKLNDVAWIGAKLKGTTYQFRVLEKEIPKKEKGLTPRNLVAKKEAIIYNIYVEQGKAAVQQDEYVKKGDVLISGTIGNENHQKIVPAKGKVLGETWYDSEAAVPLKREFKSYTGQDHTKHFIKVFGFAIPVWGFSGNSFKSYDVITKTKPFKFLKWTLPVSYEKKIYKQTVTTRKLYTKKEALAAAKRLTKKDLLAKLNEKDKILSEKVLRDSVENGKVKVLMHYTVIENIAKEQPLIEPKETE